MIAVVDETAPEGPGGIYYVVTAAIVLAEPDDARAALHAVLPPGRRRPFHWRQEGPVARDAMLTCIEDLAVVSHVCVHYPTGRRGQERARWFCQPRLAPPCSSVLAPPTTALYVAL